MQSLLFVSVKLFFVGENNCLVYRQEPVKGFDHCHQGATYAAVMSGAANVGIFASLPFVTNFAINRPLR